MKSEITSMIYMKLKWSCEFVIFKNLNRQYMSLSTAYNKEEVIDSISSDGLSFFKWQKHVSGNHI